MAASAQAKATHFVAALLDPCRWWVRWAPAVASLWASGAIVATLAIAAIQGRRCMNISPSALLHPADVIYPTLMIVAAVSYAFAGVCFNRWLRLGRLQGRSSDVLRLLLLACWLVISVFVALVALFPQSADVDTQRMHSLSADLLIVLPLLFIVAYLLLWQISDELKQTLSPRRMAIKLGITAAVPTAVIGLSIAALGYPCDGVRQWAQYFAFIGFFSSFSLELSLAWPHTTTLAAV